MRTLAGLGPVLGSLLALSPVSGALAQTQTWVPGKGHGSASVAVQQLYIPTHTLFDGTHGFPGTITSRSLFLTLDYGLSDRLAIDASLPYKSNMFDGPGRHNPGTLDDDHGQILVDDGQFHGGWQDGRVGLRYLLRDRPLRIVPFVGFGHPTHDYVTFAHSALGTGQWHLQMGVNVGRQFDPPFQKLYFQAGVAYSVLQKVEDRRVNHATFNAEVGYFLTPRLSVSVLATAQKTYNGFDFPKDYPNLHDDHYFHHDQNLRNDFVNVGAAINYRLGERYSAFATYGHTAWGENAHLIDYAITVGLSRAF